MTKKHSLYLIFGIISSLSIAGIRIVELLYAVDPETGYYINGSFSLYMLNIILVLAVAVLFTSVFTIKKDDAVLYGMNKSFLSVLSAVLLVCALVFFSVKTVINIAMSFKSAMQIDILGIVQVLFAILFAVYLIMNYLTSEKDNSQNILLAFMPLFLMIMLVKAFLTHSDNFEILALCAAVLFYTYYSKKNIVGKNNAVYFFLAVVCFMLTLFANLPNVILYGRLAIETSFIDYATDKILIVASGVFALSDVIRYEK